jgi:hypothetical protein
MRQTAKQLAAGNRLATRLNTRLYFRRTMRFRGPKSTHWARFRPNLLHLVPTLQLRLLSCLTVIFVPLLQQISARLSVLTAGMKSGTRARRRGKPLWFEEWAALLGQVFWWTWSVT